MACARRQKRKGGKSTAFHRWQLARPPGIRSIVAALGKQATVTNQSTSAEDLAQPIADAGKKLAMLRDYRARLEALRERAGSDVDALIKVNRELAQVQSELESSAGEQAYLLQRVQTELLTVSIGSQEHQAFWKPVSQALAEFGDNLSRGIATAITATAFLLPWGVLLLALLWLGRKLRLRPRWPWRRNGNS
ncbi:DUF4349 domain-containing protein [Vogesella sp. LIG4]|uniref:DUF4349 domain-containing protein n=1 Tax=Vogesella sp. LIG4 TaxID=1192162 RepID=UPI000B5AC677|nr:DUF4349 domain-containing protein [Vogesella sp. LIG4]